MLVTDMNHRERKAFADKADRLANCANKLAVALRTGDDTEVLFQLALTGVGGSFLNELTDVFKESVGVNIPDSPERLVGNTRQDKEEDK